ncbi:hypothetical protein RIF29_21533 [Crotalaria pallida]|uniref:Uncharacterized protein n=1 Tax=Crotalaria pallida TaxID=3830 RepID=A0AAN9I8I7_CROPI
MLACSALLLLQNNIKLHTAKKKKKMELPEILAQVSCIICEWRESRGPLKDREWWSLSLLATKATGQFNDWTTYF